MCFLLIIKKFTLIKYIIEPFYKLSFFFFNVGVRTSLCASRLISRALKLTIMQASSAPEVCGTQTGDF